MKKRRGFTLIELLIAISIMAVLASLATPSFLDYLDKSRVRGAAEAVYEQLQYARAQALKRSVPIIVAFSADNTTTWALGITDKPAGCNPSDTTCTVEYDNDPGIDFDGDGDVADPVLLRLEGVDFPNVIMKGSAGDSPSFGNTAGPGNCTTVSEKQACFEPIQGLSRNTTDAGHIVLTKGNYTLQVRVEESGRVKICTPAGMFVGYDSCT